MARKFKAGDWVKAKGASDSPKMEVSKYITKKEPIWVPGQGHLCGMYMVPQWPAKIPGIPPEPTVESVGHQRNLQNLAENR